jgi:putative GTP pyrophosphokinase
MNEVERLRRDYESVYPLARQFADELVHQITKLLQDGHIYPAVPVQFRVKEWNSLEEKLTRKSLDLGSVRDLHDLVGVRVILLFKRDVEAVCQLLNENLSVKEQYDTAERLQENQFGYSSNHLILGLPEAWLQVPTFAPLKGLVAEVQVRTAAQHAWAAASHVLQYKAESSVPPSVRRSINRVSALLETVDLEFERVLLERQAYREEALDPNVSEPLNVDLLEKILAAHLPAENRVPNEDYSSMLRDLQAFGVDTSEKLEALLEKHHATLMKTDATLAQQVASDPHAQVGEHERKRAAGGYWLSHTGLLRQLMRLEFGNRWQMYVGSQQMLRLG